VEREHCFRETGFCIAGAIRAYWEANGGLALNGFPISDARDEQLEDGKTYTVQYFERVRLEYHPENAAPNDVLLGQFGRRLYPVDTRYPTQGAAPPRRGATYFPETGHNLGGRFREYWEANGGLAQLGVPLSEEFVERLEDGREYTVQYFERARLELHPEHPAPYDVLLGQFGRRILATLPNAPAARTSPRQDYSYFEQTGHNVGPRFAAYWEANGGLAQFGYPLSEEFAETLEDGKPYTVQYFERARLEYHPENPAPFDILLGQFGRRLLAAGTP
jgi:phage tail protein X